jgi:hypothetical protein
VRPYKDTAYREDYYSRIIKTLEVIIRPICHVISSVFSIFNS